MRHHGTGMQNLESIPFRVSAPGKDLGDARHRHERKTTAIGTARPSCLSLYTVKHLGHARMVLKVCPNPGSHLRLTCEEVLPFLRSSLNPENRSQLPKVISSSFSSSCAAQARGKVKHRRRLDPYREAQARQRRVAHLARKDVLRQERAEAIGDPVRSRPTAFIASLKKDLPVPVEPGTKHDAQSSPLNFFLSPEEYQSSLQYSKVLTEPLPAPELADPASTQAKQERHAKDHENAERALLRIAALGSGNSKDRTRHNIQRCIGEFGRHHTDDALPPSLTATVPPARAGPDTGSSEVQVAILTTKINVLADQLEDRGKKDKHNKRNLRILVHRRQKLLAYLRRKERGGPRWQNLMERLGLGDAAWRGEISL